MISENLPATSARSESTLDAYRSAPPTRTLDRGLDLSRVNIEWVAYGLLFLISIAMHLGNLGQMAMSHDESVVSYSSWRFFMGRGDFTCAGTLPDAGPDGPQYKSQTYCYDPVYHGPTQYVLQFVSFFLFGVSDASSRLPMALAGIGLLPMCWLLRSLVGRRTALVSAVLITFSPSLLYFARYARHDGLMVLWTMFLVVGMFLWIQRGRTGDLVLSAVGLALAWATHELVFILGFIGVTFLLYRWLWEYRSRWFQIVSSLAIALGLLVSVGTAMSAPGAGVALDQATTYKFLQRILGPSILIGGGALMALLMSFSWEPTPVLTNRFRATWATRRNADPDAPKVWWGFLPTAFWWAIGAFLVVFGLLFTTFGAYPRGFLDGFYRGLEYWWLSQHEAQRGGQPWYYYLMLLPIYELLALLFAIGGIVGLVVRLIIKPRHATADEAIHSTADLTDNGHADAVEAAPALIEHGAEAEPEGARSRRLGRRRSALASSREQLVRTAVASQPSNASDTPSLLVPVASLFVPFTLYWGISSLLAYSWAGEKMPWLLIHTALPLTLYAAAVIAGLLKRIPWRKVQTNYGWAIPLLVMTFVITIFVGAFFLSGAGDTLQDTQTRTRAIPALVIAALSVFLLWTVGENLGRGTVLRLSALTLAAVLLLYGIRAISEVVYLYPDTPREPIIYTQTSPDVPVMVDVIRQTAINQSRNDRTKDDPVGGNSMKIVIDNELAWPMQWYLRDFRNIAWTQMEAATALQVDAPIILFGPGGINNNLKTQIADTHIKSAEGVFNWWFPEAGSVPDPRDPNKTVRAYKELAKDSPAQVFLWPFKPSNWPGLLKFMLYREIPHKIEGRELEMYMRADTAVGVVAAPATSTVETRQLVATAKFGTGELNGPRGVAVDTKGEIYIADSLNHRIAVYDNTGKLLRSFGTKGAGEGQFFEPSGVSFDELGNLYVADTWNARIVKMNADGKFIKSWGSGRDDFGEGRRATDTKGDPNENINNPLGFFGPRNVLVMGDRVYVADTGNKRVVVTDLEGNFVEQFGSAGAQAGQFNEPIGLGKDSQNRLFVGDTWNGRVQIFARDDQQRTIPQPVKTFTVRGWSANTYNNPYLAVAPDGRTFAGVPERAEIAVYDLEGKVSLRLKEPQITAPHGLAITADGQAVVADETNQIIQFQLP